MKAKYCASTIETPINWTIAATPIYGRRTLTLGKKPMRCFITTLAYPGSTKARAIIDADSGRLIGAGNDTRHAMIAAKSALRRTEAMLYEPYVEYRKKLKRMREGNPAMWRALTAMNKNQGRE